MFAEIAAWPDALALIWFLIIAFAIFMYVALDGFDLGVGILFVLFRNESERALAVRCIEPYWDGNETWLIVGGSSLFAAFPYAYGTLLSSFYAPIITMLLALVLRGAAMEFRNRSQTLKIWWDRAFCLGSTIAAFAQGVIVGALVQGVKVDEHGYAGDWFDWLTPFSVFTGLAVVASYCVIGAAWLRLKTSAGMRERCHTILKRIFPVLPIAFLITSIWTLTLHNDIYQRWLSMPTMLYLAPLPILFVISTVMLTRAIHAGKEFSPFFYILTMFLLCYAGLGASIYPKIAPHDVTIFDAAAPPESLSFLLLGTVFLIPCILAYSAYNYRVFHGKIN